MAPSVEHKPVPLLCSARFNLAFIAFLGYIMMYSMRVNFSVAMVCMVNNTALMKHHDNGDVNTSVVPHKCAADSLSSNGSKVEMQDGTFVWPKEIQGLLLGSFFWGYLVTQLPGGWLAAKYSAKHVVGWGMFLTAVATLLTPIGARFDWRMLIFLRFLAGLAEGVLWPATNALWAYWAPPLERSKLNGFTNAGAQLGNVLTLPISALLCEYGFDGGWPSIFYIIGSVTVVWFIAWMLLVTDRPETHPRISEQEKTYIQTSLLGQTRSTGDKKMSVPWVSILTSVPFWALQITQLCGLWGTYLFLTSIPTYMRDVLHLDIKSNGFYSAIPYIGMWIMINFSAFLADNLRSRGIMSTTVARKFFNTVGQLVPAIVCLGLGFVECTHPGLAISLLTLGVAFIGWQYGAGFIVNCVDIAPKYASVIFGITNSIGSISGFLAPYTVGILTTNQSQREWRNVFYITTAIYAVGITVFLVGGSGELQPWAREEEDEEEKGETDLPHLEDKDTLMGTKDKKSDESTGI